MALLRQQTPSLGRKIFGWSCVLVGLAGLLLPLLPGIPILIVGIMTLATQHRWARALVVWAKRKFKGRRKQQAVGTRV